LEIKIDDNSGFDKNSSLKAQSEEDEVVEQLNKFIEASTILSSKNSPFLGIQEKEVTKEALLGLLRVEECHKVKLSDTGEKIRSKMIDEAWA
jgi:hypothetical protein